MPDFCEINREIRKLEREEQTSYKVCERLAILYTVRDHQQNPSAAVDPGGYSYAASPTSDFLRAVDGAPLDRLFGILDEHMEAVRILYPKEYAAVIRMINATK